MLWEVVISLSFWFTCSLFPGASSTSRSYASSVKREGVFELQVYICYQVYTIPSPPALSGLVRSSHRDFSLVWEGRASKGGKEKVLLGGCGLQRDSQTCPSADSGSNEWVSQPFPLCFGSTNTAGCLLALCNIPQADLYPWIKGHSHQNLHQRVLCGWTYLSLSAGEGRGERLRMECSFS